jgi:hypothetical protein
MTQVFDHPVTGRANGNTGQQEPTRVARATPEDSTQAEVVEDKGIINRIRNLSFASGLMLAIGLDIIDMITAWVLTLFFPGGAQVINAIWEIIQTFFAWVLSGPIGALAIWELLEPTGLIDAFFPTITVIYVGVSVARKVFKKFPGLSKAPLLGPILNKLLPGVNTEGLRRGIEKAEDLIQNEALLEGVDKALRLNMNVDRSFVLLLRDIKTQIKDPGFIKHLGDNINLKNRTLQELISHLEELKRQNFIGRTTRGRLALYVGKLESLNAKLYEVQNVLEDPEKLVRELEALKVRLLEDNGRELQVLLLELIEKGKPQISEKQ